MPWYRQIHSLFLVVSCLLASSATAQEPSLSNKTSLPTDLGSGSAAGDTGKVSDKGDGLTASRERWNQQPPPEEASSSQRLIMVQIEELILAGEFSEAISNLEKLIDRGGERLIEIGGVQRAGTQSLQRFSPLHRWVQQRLVALLNSNQQLRKDYQDRLGPVSDAEFQRLQESKHIIRTREAAHRFLATESGYRFGLMLADLYLEQGWTIAALQATETVAAAFRPTTELDSHASPGLPWVLMWRHLDAEANTTRKLLERVLARTNVWGLTNQQLVERVIPRMLAAVQLNRLAGDRQLWLDWLTKLISLIEPESGDALDGRLDNLREGSQLDSPDTWHTFAGNNTRNPPSPQPTAFDSWPSWTQTLPTYTANSDRTPASQPRVAEASTGALPYHPVINDGKIYLNLMTEIVAFELSNGRPWPRQRPAAPLFSSGTGPVAYLPLGYPYVGTPRGTLTVDDKQLFARMGPAVTGSANDQSSEDGGSKSYLIGLDLERQGSMLRGFPIRLVPPEFEGHEFEGPPLLWGDLVLVAVSQREDVGLRRSVVAFDRRSGELVWKSVALAAGSVAGTERANLISHQVLSEAGGRIFYNTNLGSIACLDPLDGTTIWLTQYTRSVAADANPQPNRFRYRDLTPCLVDRGLVYCAPQDCPEVFALSATTGDLVWSTDSVQASDVIHLLGVHGDHLIASGDRLLWIDRLGGRVESRFPGSTTAGITNALPHPRGMGRGMISGDEILFPISGEILVFDASVGQAAQTSPLGAQPRLLRRKQLGARSRDGGNIVLVGDQLLYVSPSRLMSFQREKNDSLSLTD